MEKDQLNLFSGQDKVDQEIEVTLKGIKRAGSVVKYLEILIFNSPYNNNTSNYPLSAILRHLGDVKKHLVGISLTLGEKSSKNPLKKLSAVYLYEEWFTSKLSHHGWQADEVDKEKLERVIGDIYNGVDYVLRCIHRIPAEIDTEDLYEANELMGLALKMFKNDIQG